MVTLTLTPAEILHGALCGSMRQVQNLRDNRANKYGCRPEDGWTVAITGALGELAVAKYLGRYWEGLGALGDFGAADVLGVNVRATTDPRNALILRAADADDRPFVLASGSGRAWTLHGWILGRDGKIAEFERDPHGRGAAYFVPQTRLSDIATLPAFLAP